jgi:hypothetical protein
MNFTRCHTVASHINLHIQEVAAMQMHRVKVSTSILEGEGSVCHFWEAVAAASVQVNHKLRYVSYELFKSIFWWTLNDTMCVRKKVFFWKCYVQFEHTKELFKVFSLSWRSINEWWGKEEKRMQMYGEC